MVCRQIQMVKVIIKGIFASHLINHFQIGDSFICDPVFFKNLLITISQWFYFSFAGSKEFRQRKHFQYQSSYQLELLFLCDNKHEGGFSWGLVIVMIFIVVKFFIFSNFFIPKTFFIYFEI